MPTFSLFLFAINLHVRCFILIMRDACFRFVNQIYEQLFVSSAMNKMKLLRNDFASSKNVKVTFLSPPFGM
jgi:hypothetical protein